MRHHVTAAEVRSRLGHPVIDADGHWVELVPMVEEAMRRIGGQPAAAGFMLHIDRVEHALKTTLSQRRAERIPQPGWWSTPTARVVDRATAMMPSLLGDRLDELGIDFSVLFPSYGLPLGHIDDARMRAASCRAFNIFSAEHFDGLGDRMTPAAVIPMHTPGEAIDELVHVREELGLKAVVMTALVRRPIVRDGQAGALWHDPLGLDSVHDYDEVWSACVELGVAPAFHAGTRGSGLRASPSNMTYNHIGHFAAAGEAICKALFLGGVTRRFPRLRCAFLVS